MHRTVFGQDITSGMTGDFSSWKYFINISRIVLISLNKIKGPCRPIFFGTSLSEAQVIHSKETYAESIQISFFFFPDN